MKYLSIIVLGLFLTACPSPEPPKQINDCATLCADLKAKQCKEGLNEHCTDTCNNVVEARLTSINNFAKKCTLESK